MTFALVTRAQALCRVQLRTSQPPSQRALIPYSWHLSFVSLFNEAHETLGVQLIVINNKSNPLLPLILFIIYYKRFNGKRKKRSFRTASLHLGTPLVTSYKHNHNRQYHILHLRSMLLVHMRNSDMWQVHFPHQTTEN